MCSLLKVAGVVGRADVLSGAFFLACILCYHRSTRSRNAGGCYIWMALSIISCICSALCKELGLTAAAMCLVLDSLSIQKWSLSKIVSVQKFLDSVSRPFIKRSLLVFVCVAAFMMFRLSIMKHQPILDHSLNPAVWLFSPYRQLHWAYLSFYNFFLLLYPSRLSADYSMGTIPLINSIVDSRNLITLFSLCFVSYLGLFLLRANEKDLRNRIPIFGLTLMIIPFLPASNLFFPVGFVVAERVLYLPSMGFCMLVAHGVWKVISSVKSNHIKILINIAVALLLILHVLKTLERNRAWFSEELLYREAVRAYPHNGKMLHNLATKVSETDLLMAEELLRMSAKVEPKYVSAFSDLGMVLSQQNKVKRAEEVYWRAVDLTQQALSGDTQVTSSVKNLKTFTRLAKLLKQNSSRLQEAFHLCQNITNRLKTRGIKYSKIYAEMGDISIRLGDYRSAKVAIDTALYQDPTNVVAVRAFAKLNAQQGNVSAAEKVLRTAIKRVGLQLPLALEMATHLLRHHNGKMLRVREAENMLLQVLLTDANNTEALFTLGQLYADNIIAQPSKAIKLLSRAIELRPTHKEARLSLAKVYAVEGRCREAMEVLDETLSEDAEKILNAC